MRRLLTLLTLLTLSGLAAHAQMGNTVTVPFAGAPSGSCSVIMYAINTSNGDFYDCPSGSWVKVGSSGGAGVSSVGLTVNSTSPSGIYTVTGSPVTTTGTLNINLAGTSGGVPYFSSGTVLSSSGALTVNVPVLGGGAGATPTPSAIETHSATAVTNTGTGGYTLNGTGNQITSTQGTITTSAPFTTHTVTWNAAGVAFTNWLSNLTCTAAATGSIAAGFGTAGTQWQFKYGAANCASPQLLSPDGTVALPAYAFGAATGTGFSRNGANIVVSIAGGAQISLTSSSGVSLNSGDWYVWSSTSDPTAAHDTSLARSAAKSVQIGVNGDSTGNIKVAAYKTDTNCAAVGTAANPSVASCTGATAGSFSCATNASTGTCTVNTTAVTVNSEIFIEGRNDTTTGTRLGVTCNTGITTALPEISAVVAATSFTINLGTFTSNPECFSYFIVN